MEIVHKKNMAYYLGVPMIDSATPANFKTGLTVADTAYRRDGEGGWTALDITDTFAEVGSTGIYFITLSAAELNHDQVLIKLSSANAADSMVLFRMYDNDIDDIAGDVDNTNDNVLEVVDDVAAVAVTVDGIKSTSPGDNVINN